MLLLFSLWLGAADASSQFLAEGRAYYHEAQYADAIIKLEQLVAAPDLPVAIRIDAFLLIGCAQAALGNDKMARGWFRDALAIDPHAHLAASSSPKLLLLFEEARDKDQPAISPRIIELPATRPSAPVTPPASQPLSATSVETHKPFYRTWWFWTLSSVVVAGAAAGTTAYLLTRPQTGKLNLSFQMPP